MASRLGLGEFRNVYGSNGSNVTAGQQDYAERMNQIEQKREEYYKLAGVAPGLPTMKGSYADPEVTGVGYNVLIDSLGDHSVPENWVQHPVVNTEAGSNPGAPLAWGSPENPDDAVAGYGYVPCDTSEVEETFYYHSDHLGSTAYITDQKANVTQYDAYLPYGELLVDEHSSSADLPYKFNGKELDEETGLYYYGARYMNPLTSMWYGVDPLAEKYVMSGSYVYCLGNPVKLVDPDGKDPSTHTDEKGNVVAVYNDGDLGVYVHKGNRANALKETQTNYSKNNTSANGTKVGETWTPLGFADFGRYEKNKEIVPQDGAFIDFKSNWATTKVNELIKENPSMVSYAYNARSKKECKWNFKGNTPNNNVSYGSLLYGKYASARDVGNFGAGIVKARSSADPDFIQYGYGKYNESGNSIWRTFMGVLLDYHLLSGQSGTNPAESYYNMKFGQERMQKTIEHGENPLSQAGIDAGFNYWKSRSKK